MKAQIYNSYDGTIRKTAEELNINFYHDITSHRYLLKDIDEDKNDIKHILKTILESNSTYFVVGTDIGDMNSTEVFGKVDLVKILKKYDFFYGIAYIDYDDTLLSLDIIFKKNISEFKNSRNIDIFMSYNDLAKIIPGILMDETMSENWDKIKHWWKQKELFKKFRLIIFLKL
ncbi:hypothetical protein [uncultured Clostridium sp.]|uniref:hypothetical protein n=1 Tax=uncultured Clostridium sp. TaxID=59620 RepID=UPI0028F11DBB|nr:hypothetical protein [uncultured Clostridium sp.]